MASALKKSHARLRDEGCATFFVATLARRPRCCATCEPAAAIYVLDGLLPGAAAYYAGFDLRPCLGSLAEVREWAAYCDATGRQLGAAVHIDTGINRLGLPPRRSRYARGRAEASSRRSRWRWS